MGTSSKIPPSQQAARGRSFNQAHPALLQMKGSYSLMQPRKRPAHFSLRSGPPAASPFYLVLGKVSWAQTHLQLPLLGEANPGEGSFLPRTSIAPGEQRTARRLLPEVSSEMFIFHANTEQRRIGEAKIFQRMGILFLSKILAQQKILKGINKSNPQASCSKPCFQPTTPCSTIALTDSGLYSFYITQEIPEPNLFSSTSNISRGNLCFESWLGASRGQKFNFIFFCGSSLISIIFWMRGKVSKHSCCLVSIPYCCCFFKEGEKEKNSLETKYLHTDVS